MKAPPQQSSLADTLSPRFYGAQLWHCVNIGTAGDDRSHFTVLCKSVVQHVTDLMHHCMKNTHEVHFKVKCAVQINLFHCKPPQPHHELETCPGWSTPLSQRQLRKDPDYKCRMDGLMALGFSFRLLLLRNSNTSLTTPGVVCRSLIHLLLTAALVIPVWTSCSSCSTQLLLRHFLQLCASSYQITGVHAAQ